MKQSKVILAVFVVFLFLVVPADVCNNKSAVSKNKIQKENKTQNNKVKLSREDKIKILKYFIESGYSSGRDANSMRDCYDISENAKRMFREAGKEWTREIEMLNNMAFNACVVGYHDKLDGEYKLPEILAEVDMALVYY